MHLSFTDITCSSEKGSFRAYNHRLRHSAHLSGRNLVSETEAALYLDLNQQGSETGDELCEAGVGHTLLPVLRTVTKLYHLLGLFFTPPPQLCWVVCWNHALIWSKLDRYK